MLKKIKLGMIGGGASGSIGEIHRFALNLGNIFELCAGVFSHRQERNLEVGKALGIDQNRLYPDFETMFLAEMKRPIQDRIQAVSIVTPNHLHFPISQMALKSGFHVMCEKPGACSLSEAHLLNQTVNETGLIYCINYTKAGYPMVKEARALVMQGKLGKIRKVFVHYPQGWLATQPTAKNAQWRNDPAKSGRGGTTADVGTHAFHLAEYISGEKVTHLSAMLNCYMPNRQLDDDCSVLLKFTNEATGVLTATQIAVGEPPNLQIAIYGEIGGLKWQHAYASQLELSRLDQPLQILRAGIDNSHFDRITLRNGCTPAGQFEGHIEAFANHYQNFALAIAAFEKGEPLGNHIEFPSIEAAIRGNAFVETALQSSQSQEKWTPLLV